MGGFIMENSLEDMLNDLGTLSGTTLSNVEASSDVTVSKVPEESPVVESPGFEENTEMLDALNKEEELSIKEKILKKLARYDTINSEQIKNAMKHEELYNKILQAVPELAEELRQLEETQNACENEIEVIKKELLPMFQVAVAEDPDNKTLLCNKVQATYVYPTKKHSFDLKDFMEKESAFYFDNISKFAPYAKISDVSDSVKVTIKK
jgi:seryl-tRNA synthetase